MTPLSGEIGSLEENSMEVKESYISNEAFAFVEDSIEQTPTDEALKDSSSSGAKVMISSDTGVLIYCGVDKEMTLREAAESGHVQDASSISKSSTSETDFVEEAPVTNGHGSSPETSYIELPKEAQESIYSLPAVVAPDDALLDSKNLDAVRDLCDEPLATEGVSFAFDSESQNKVKEIAGDHRREILVVTEDSIDRDLQDASQLEVSVEILHVAEALQEGVKETGSNLTGEILQVPPQEAGELAAKEFVDVPPRESESIDRVLQDASELEVSVEMPQEVKETGGNLTGETLEVPPQESCELAAEEFVDVHIQESEISRDASFEISATATVGGSISMEEGKETSGAALIEEPIESMEVLQKTEIFQDVYCELQISVPSTELCVGFSAAEDSSAAIITETFPEIKEGADDHSTNEFNGCERDMCSTKTTPLSEFSIVQKSTDSEVADLAAVEMTEEKEDTKAAEKQKSFEDENIAAELSLVKLKAIEQKLGDGKNEVGMVEEKWEENNAEAKDKSVKTEKLVDLSLTKLRAMYKQKLDDRKNEVEKRKSVNKQEDSQCLSHSKLNCTQNDDRNKLGKRTPLKNLN